MRRAASEARRAVMGAATALGLALLTVGVPAVAQGFPNKPVRIVVPFPPGGGVEHARAKGLDVIAGGPAELAAAIREDVALTGAMAAAARVQPE